jgi:hypothetical protein
MLSVKPGRVMGGNGLVDPAAVATVSLALLTTVTLLPVGL